MNQRVWVRQAYDKALQTYDGLIMPTIPFVARKLPPANMDVTSFIAEALANTMNTSIANLTGHPAITLNVGKVLPESSDEVSCGKICMRDIRKGMRLFRPQAMPYYCTTVHKKSHTTLTSVSLTKIQILYMCVDFCPYCALLSGAKPVYASLRL